MRSITSGNATSALSIFDRWVATLARAWVFRRLATAATPILCLDKALIARQCRSWRCGNSSFIRYFAAMVITPRRCENDTRLMQIEVPLGWGMTLQQNRRSWSREY